MQEIVTKKFDRVDSSCYFELKYFLTDAQKEVVNEDNEDT